MFYLVTVILYIFGGSFATKTDQKEKYLLSSNQNGTTKVKKLAPCKTINLYY